MPKMTGRPGHRTMEMNGGSSAPYLACTPCVPLFVHCSLRVEAEGLFRLPGAGGDHFHCMVEPSPGPAAARSYSVSSSVSSLLRNSTLETVFHPAPILVRKGPLSGGTPRNSQPGNLPH